MDNNSMKLNNNVLMIVQNHPLFYPCSGSDYFVAINLFVPFIKEYWFADLAYFNDPNLLETQEPILLGKKNYSFLHFEIEKDLIPIQEWKTDRKYHGIPPCIRTEVYLHKSSGQEIRVHLHRRRGPTAMRERIINLGVFFFRGCSDEGSSTNWLTPHKRSGKKGRRGQFDEVLDKLIDGGLIVTDGSMCFGENNPYREFKRFSVGRNIGPRAVELAKPFEDKEGRNFTCVGYAGKRYGPTLVWQVKKPINP